jgi:hypothetical protein
MGQAFVTLNTRVTPQIDHRLREYARIQRIPVTKAIDELLSDALDDWDQELVESSIDRKDS